MSIYFGKYNKWKVLALGFEIIFQNLSGGGGVEVKGVGPVVARRLLVELAAMHNAAALGVVRAEYDTP